MSIVFSNSGETITGKVMQMHITIPTTHPHKATELNIEVSNFFSTIIENASILVAAHNGLIVDDILSTEFDSQASTNNSFNTQSLKTNVSQELQNNSIPSLNTI
eukprot:330953_1